MALAALVRLYGIDWDSGHAFHPDERRLTMAVMEVSFCPVQLNPYFFAYGSLPIYLVRIIGSLLSFFDPSWNDFSSLIWVGRNLSAVMGLLTVMLLVRLGERLYSRPVGLLAGFLLGACVLHIQNSHFMTVDVPLTFFVLLTLSLLISAVRFGHPRNFALAGASLGMAIATKFSALPLVFPFAVAILLLNRSSAPDGGWCRSWRALVGLSSALITFFIAQPFAFLDFAAYVHDLTMQARMVRDAGLVPYTNQYIGTTHYVYELSQLVLWSMAPPLGLAAIWATVRRSYRTFRDLDPAQIILCAWVLPFFLIAGGFEVRFVRYLLPIYPIMILWASEWLWEISRVGTNGRILLWIVSIGTLASALAFCSIYTRDHTAVSASNWVYQNIPANSVIMTTHWEEGFPLPLSSGNPGRYRIAQLPFYEPDTTAKLQSISESLAVADYIVFPTQRIYGAITQASDKFPLSSQMLYQLFAGDLGYLLVHADTSRPGLLGFTVPDEWGDESLTVYDHPRVLIFRNSAKLDAGTIFRRTMTDTPSRLPTRHELLSISADTVEVNKSTSPTYSAVFSLFRFCLLVEALGLAAYYLLRRWLPVTGSYALAKIFGVFGLAYALWLPASLGLSAFSQAAILVTTLIFIGGGALARRFSASAMDRTEWLTTETIFWGFFTLFLVVRSYNPSIFWGEKPMDFAILNALFRTEALPPPEPWFSGSVLHYSYFGHFAIATLGKACGLAPAVAYNLGIGLCAGLIAVAAFAGGCALSGRLQTGILSAVIVGLIGNLSALRELWHRHALDFDYFWATSRVIPGTINEYPSWSLLFADLHAHVLVMPLSLGFIALMVWLRRARGGHPHLSVIPLGLLGGFFLGAIPVTNTWSLFIYAAFTPFFLGLGELETWLGLKHARGYSAIGWLITGLALMTVGPDRILALTHLHGQQGVVPPLLGIAMLACFGLAAHRLLPVTTLATMGMLTLAVVLFLPHWLRWHSPPRQWGWVSDGFVQLPELTLIFGFFLFVALSYLLLNVWRGSRQDSGRVWPAVILIAASFPLLAFSHPYIHEWLGLSGEGSVRTGMATLALSGIYLSLHNRGSATRRQILTLLSFACLIIVAADWVFIWDRMNTVFKFYLEAWLLFSLAIAAATEELRQVRLGPRWLKMVWLAGCSALFMTSILTVATALGGLLANQRVRTPYPTLDGIAYLELRNPHESAAIQWLNRHVRGIPVIAEAQGPFYSEYARVSMNTGLPTILGWDYHVSQRGQHWGEIDRRKIDIRALYMSESAGEVESILRRYHIALVYVGELERREYAGGNLSRFENWKTFLHAVYRNAEVTIFAVIGQFMGAIPSTTIEAVPESVAEAATLPAGQLSQPRGIGLDADGNVYVSDFGNDRLQKFDSNLAFVAFWGRQGTLPGQFKQPGSLFVDRQRGKLLVADTWNHRVQILSMDGAYLGEWGRDFYGPRGITASRDGDVYITDTGKHRVRRFTLGGEERQGWGGPGSKPGEFWDPVGVATDNSGRVYVCDNGNGRLQIFDRDGAFLKAFPVDGWQQRPFSEPHVELVGNTIWVTVPLMGAVRAYDFNGKLLHEIMGSEQSDAKRFTHPMGLAYDAPGNALLISDLELGLLRLPLAQDGNPR